MSPQSGPPPMTVVEKHPLLDQDDDSIYEEEYPTVQTKPLAGRASWPHLFVLLVTLLIGLSTGFATSHIISNKSRRVQNNTFSPAHDALSYSQQSMHPHGPKTYYGQPSMEQTKAWEKLLEPVMIRASYDELARAGESPESSIQLQAGGYLASLGVYHDLHCLRRIRFFLYEDHFYPNMTVEQREEEGKHVEHCFEALRIATMCAGSTGLWTFDWQPNVTKAHPKTAAQRTCVDWDVLDSWSRERAVGFNPPLKPRPQGV